MMAEGVGAWRVPRYYARGMKLPSDPYQRNRVRWATIAIQRDLIRKGFLDADPDQLDGGFGPKTDDAARRFQAAHGLVVDGLVGRKTTTVLFSDWFRWWERVLGIPDRLVYGMCALESSMDPGAEGAIDDRDRGIAQFNRLYWPSVSDEEAFSRVDLCVMRAAGNLVDAYKSLGVMSYDPAIAHHNNPVKARAWASSGQPPDEQIKLYVSNVRKAAARA